MLKIMVQKIVIQQTFQHFQHRICVKDCLNIRFNNLLKEFFKPSCKILRMWYNMMRRSYGSKKSEGKIKSIFKKCNMSTYVSYICAAFIDNLKNILNTETADLSSGFIAVAYSLSCSGVG